MKKFDKDKPRSTLISPWAIEVLWKVATKGAGVHGEYNWLDDPEWTRLVAAADRHILAIRRGEDIDPESGLPHAGHLMWNAHALLHCYLKGVGIDDRRFKDEV